MRFEHDIEPASVDTAPPTPPRRNLKTIAMLLAITLWPLAVYVLPKAFPGRVRYSLEGAAQAVQASSINPALPAAASGHGQQAGPAPFWEDPPDAIVRAKMIIPAEARGNPYAQ